MDPNFVTDLLQYYRYRSYWRRWWPTTTSTKTMWCHSSAL